MNNNENNNAYHEKPHGVKWRLVDMLAELKVVYVHGDVRSGQLGDSYIDAGSWRFLKDDDTEATVPDHILRVLTFIIEPLIEEKFGECECVSGDFSIQVPIGEIDFDLMGHKSEDLEEAWTWTLDPPSEDESKLNALLDGEA